MAKSPSPRSRSNRSNQSRRSRAPRLPVLDMASLTGEQQALVDAISSGPRGRFSNSGPFAVYLHAPGFGHLAQQLGGYVRLGTSVPPRLSELAILCTARFWQAQYEWVAHAAIAAKQGVKPGTIRDLQAGRTPRSAPRDEMAIYAFARELYATRRVSDATYKRVHKLVGDAGMVELVGILGYYAMVSMILNAFRMPVPEGTPAPFREANK
jgi:4-carboxymuconolactone decarboxylase